MACCKIRGLTSGAGCTTVWLQRGSRPLQERRMPFEAPIPETSADDLVFVRDHPGKSAVVTAAGICGGVQPQPSGSHHRRQPAAVWFHAGAPDAGSRELSAESIAERCQTAQPERRDQPHPGLSGPVRTGPGVSGAAGGQRRTDGDRTGQWGQQYVQGCLRNGVWGQCAAAGAEACDGGLFDPRGQFSLDPYGGLVYGTDRRPALPDAQRDGSKNSPDGCH